MIWVAWRQQRTPLLALAAVTAVLGAALVYLRFAMQAADPGTGAFESRFEGPATLLLYAVLALPLLTGMFLGAPLFAREFEQQTHLLVSSQAVSRLGWALTKVGVAAGAAGAAMLVLAVLFGWMHAASGGLLDDVAGRFGRATFEAQGLLPAVYAVFAVAAGAGIGLLVRTAVTAVGLTLALFGVARYGLEQLRPHLLAPQVARQPLAGVDGLGTARGPAGSMELDSQAGYVDAAGTLLAQAAAEARMQCEVARDAACAAEHGFVAVYGTFHGPQRYWPFQLAEAGILLVLAAALLAAGLYWFASRPR